MYLLIYTIGRYLSQFKKACCGKSPCLSRMEKLLFLLVMLLLPFGVSAQEFLKIEDVDYDKICSVKHTNEAFRRSQPHKWDLRTPKKVLLSNGLYLSRWGTHLYSYIEWLEKRVYWTDNDDEYIKTNLSDFRDVPKDKCFIYHIGKTYWVETISYKGTLTIKSVKVREVKRETSASLNGDFSYDSFFALFEGTGGGGGSANGKISGSMRGGTKTVVNLIFDNGTYASIEASDEPIWLEAEAGMKVKLYKLRNTKLYELIL